jgi:hypothetical protein
LAGNTSNNTNDPSASYVYSIEDFANGEYSLHGTSTYTCNYCCVNAGVDVNITTCDYSNQVVIGTSTVSLCAGGCSGSYCPDLFSWTPTTPAYLSCYNCPQPTFNIGCPRTAGNIVYTLTVAKSSGCTHGCAQTTDQVTVSWTACASCDGKRIGNFETDMDVENSKISVFPNPSSGKITVRFDADFNGAVVQVYSLDGKMAAEVPVTGSELEIDLSKKAKGAYLIQVTKGDLPLMNKKVVIE